MTSTLNQSASPRTAGDLMTSPVITLNVNSTVADVAEVMIERKIGSIILVDDEGIFHGIITENAFLPTQTVYPFARGKFRQLMGVYIGTEENASYGDVIEKLKSTVCSEVMDTAAPTVAPDASIDELCEEMANSEKHHVTVLQDGRPVGMVARHDMLRLFLS